MESRKDNLSAQSNDILLIISKFRASDINLCKASKRFSFFKQQPLYQQRLKKLRLLLSHAALGEWDAAQTIWSTDPSLLACPGTIYHPNRIYEEGKDPIDIPADKNPGRYKYVDRTAWQIALMNEEYKIAEEMAEHMGEEEKKQQFSEIFPDGKLVKHNWDLKEAKKRLDEVFAAVIKDASINPTDLDIMSESTRSALNALYDYVKPAPEHQTGLVFDANIYVEALKLYEEKFDEFKNANNKWDQRSFWCIRVEEYLASLLGTGYLRRHAQGTYNDLQRSGCILADNSSYFAFRRAANSIPGHHFFVGIYGWRMRSGRANQSALVRVASRFSAIMSSKNKSRDGIYGAIFAPHPIGNMSNLLK